MSDKKKGTKKSPKDLPKQVSAKENNVKGGAPKLGNHNQTLL